MTWKPTSRTPLQYVDSNGDPYSGAVLKFYEDGTSTTLTAASDNAGATTFTSVALNSSGYPAVSGNEVVIYLQEDYKMVLYPDQSSADANTGAVWSVDNLCINVDETFDSATFGTIQVNDVVKVGSASAGTDGDKVIVLENGTAPTSGPANTVQLYATDLSTGNTQLSIYTEGTAIGGTTTSVHTRAERVNGTQKYVLVSADSGNQHNHITPTSPATSASSTGGTLTLDLSASDSFYVSLTENITTITFSNAPTTGRTAYVEVEYTQHATASYTVTTSGQVWTGGSDWVMSTGNGDIDVVTYRSRDAFSTIYGAVSWQNAS